MLKEKLSDLKSTCRKWYKVIIYSYYQVLMCSLEYWKKKKFICNMLIIWKHTSKYQSAPNKFTITSCLQIGVSLKISNNYVFFQNVFQVQSLNL